MGNYQPCGNNSFFLVAAFQRRWWVRPWANILVENWYDDWDSTKRTRDPRTIVCVIIRIVNWSYVTMTSYYFGENRLVLVLSIRIQYSFTGATNSFSDHVTSLWRHLDVISWFIILIWNVVTSSWHSDYFIRWIRLLQTFVVRRCSSFGLFTCLNGFFTRCVGFNIQTHLGIVSILERYTSRPSDLWTLI